MDPGSIPGRQRAFSRVFFACYEIMNQEQRLDIFKAQTANVRELNSAWSHLKRSINRDLVKNNQKSLHVHTRLLALTYCAWTEALFSKLIHTPHSLSLVDISQIKVETKANGVTAGWKKCVQLALKNMDGAKDGLKANVAKAISKLIKEYIEEPSILRNKIAHGQVVEALNKNNTNINPSITSKLKELNIVTLDRHKFACQGLSDIVENIIESPRKAAIRDYWPLTVKIQRHLEETRNFTIEQKAELLKEKTSHNK
jgi:hypothetical protein